MIDTLSEEEDDPNDPDDSDEDPNYKDKEDKPETDSSESEPDNNEQKVKANSPSDSFETKIKSNFHKTQPEGTCVKCEKQFPSTMALESHHMEEHMNETWYCYDCLCGFPNFKTWKYHKRNFCKKSAVIRICTLCQETFKSYEELKVHAEKCKGQSVKGSNDAKPVEKINPQNDKPTFRCSFCSIETHNNSEFLEHLKVHKKNAVSVLKCNHCDKTFKEKGALICHREFQHKNRPSPSSVKQKPGIDQSDANTNDKTAKLHLSRKYKEYKCNTCDQNFVSSGKLICHQVLAHKKK